MAKLGKAWFNLVTNVNEEATLWMHLLNLALLPVFPVVYLAVLIVYPSKLPR